MSDNEDISLESPYGLESPSNLDNDYINQLTLNFLISKTQLNKLNKLKQKDISQKYDKERVCKLFNKLLNDDKPSDLLEDVKTSFDAFIEKSIYYLEIHDKNETIQNERNSEKEYDIKEDINYDDKDEDEEDDDKDEDDREDEDDDEDAVVADEYFEEYRPVITQKSKYSKQNRGSNGVDDIQKLPLDWFNTTRQTYKINQIISRKKEIIVDNPTLKKVR
jgi:hypothetical protein